jgi:acyl-CoA synthetase (AMP-forming)/AMP-acid ligase II
VRTPSTGSNLRTLIDNCTRSIALSHRNILNNGILIGRGMKLEFPSETFAGERLCNTPPVSIPIPIDPPTLPRTQPDARSIPQMFHCFGLVLGNLAVYTHAGCIVFASETFDASLSLRAVHQEKCTALHGVPTMFLAQLALLDDLEKGLDVPNLSDLGKLDFSSLR